MIIKVIKNNDVEFYFLDRELLAVLLGYSVLSILRYVAFI